MAQTEIKPEITALIYDASGGTHFGDLTLFDEQAEVGRVGNGELTDSPTDVTDILALNALHGYRNWDRSPQRSLRLHD